MPNCPRYLPILSAADVAAIRQKFDELARLWAEVPLGGRLELAFPADETPEGHQQGVQE